MRRSWLLLSLLLCGALCTTTAAAARGAPLDPSTSSSDAASLVSTPMTISEFTVDQEGLWTDTEVPLSDASMRAIREATPASPQDEEDIATTVVYTAPTTATNAMETNAVDENVNENENELHVYVAEDGIESETDDQTPITLDDAESAESETSATSAIDLEEEIDIAAGSHGRMILIPHSSRFEMAPLVNRLTRIISELKQLSPQLDRITLKLEIEPIIPRTRGRARHVDVIPRARVHPLPPRARARARLDLVRPPSRPRPVSIRLIPSRSEIRTRAMLARCRMLLRQALKKLKRMKLRRTHHPRLASHRKTRMTRLARFLRSLGVGRVRGVTILHGNNFTHTDHSTRRISRGNIDVEAEQNSTARVFAPTITLRMHGGSMLVVNRGVIVIVNRSANNTVSVTSPPPSSPSPSPHHRGMYRRFMIPSSRAHVEVSASVNANATPALATSNFTPNEN